jgi:hypothetical protein
MSPEEVSTEADYLEPDAPESQAHGRLSSVRDGIAGRGSRLSRGSSRSRRDIRQDVRDVRSGRRGVKLAGVAGVVLVLALGTFAIKGFFWSSSSDVQAGDTGTTLNMSAAGSRVVTTGTAYTDDGLADQAHELMELVAAANSTESAAAKATASGEADTASVDGPAIGNLALRDPAELDGCLSALHAGNKEPVAVDLATFDGQEAAVIILLGEGGGYEVWVVARTCSASSEETMKFLQLPA